MDRRPFYQFTPEDDKAWAALWERQYPEVQKHAHTMYLDGLAKLNLPHDRVPNFEQLNELFKQEVGWELVSTPVQYSDGQDWFEALARKEFLITEYIRDMDTLDYTPLPDIWHDAFGHLPFMIHQEYADYVQEFALKSIQFPKDNRHGLGSLWWYSVEFGLMLENGTAKAFGAGLMSGYTELQRIMNGTVPQKRFTLECMENIDPSPHEYHTEMFVFDDFAHLKQCTEDWYAQHLEQRLQA